MAPQISVLIPVYNTEKYLLQCLQSISAQTFADFEIVVINDGSADNSLKILQEYAQQEPRLRVLDQANAGVAQTRNHLLAQAQGEYVCFVDSDDWVAPTYSEALHAKATQTNADLTKCFFKQYNEKLGEYEKVTFLSTFYKCPSGKPLDRIRAGYADSVVCGKLYLNSWLKEIKLSFLKGQVSEDSGFSALAFFYARKIAVVPEELYMYRKGTTGTITSNRTNMIVGALQNRLYVLGELLRRGKVQSEVIDQLTHYITGDLCRFRKMSVDARKAQTNLMAEAWGQLHKYMSSCSASGKARLRCLFALAGKPDTKRFYFWTKLFR